MKNSLNCRQSEKGYISVVPIVPLLWGMAFLAVGFILYPLLGLWGLLIPIVGGVAGMYVGIRMMKSANEKDKQDGK